MDFLKLFYRVVGVDLGRGQVFVPEQLLYRHQAGALVQEMRGEGVTQHMGAFLLQRGDAFEHTVHLIIYVRGRHLLPFIVEEQAVGTRLKGGVAQGLVSLYQFYHLR